MSPMNPISPQSRNPLIKMGILDRKRDRMHRHLCLILDLGWIFNLKSYADDVDIKK
jgi:hypothetical protein